MTLAQNKTQENMRGCGHRPEKVAYKEQMEGKIWQKNSTSPGKAWVSSGLQNLPKIQLSRALFPSGARGDICCKKHFDGLLAQR